MYRSLDQVVRTSLEKTLVPCRVLHRHGLALPPLCEGAGGPGGELSSQHHRHLSPEKHLGACMKPSIPGLEMGQLKPQSQACGPRAAPGPFPFCPGPRVHTCAWAGGCSGAGNGSGHYRDRAQTSPVVFPSLPSSFPARAERPRPSPAELARVIHVRACLNVPFLGVVDGGSSGIRPTQDENEAIEGDGRSVLVVCEESRASRSEPVFRAAPSPPFPSPVGPPEDGLWQDLQCHRLTRGQGPGSGGTWHADERALRPAVGSAALPGLGACPPQPPDLGLQSHWA